MKIFLNPIGISDEALTLIFIIKATIAVIVFALLLGLTIHIYKKHKNDTDGSENEGPKKNFTSLIVADCLVMAFVIIILALID